jgi:hypothetical protein
MWTNPNDEGRMTNEAKTTNAELRWTAVTVAVAVLFVASLGGAVHYWPGRFPATLEQQDAGAAIRTTDSKSAVLAAQTEPIDPDVLRRRAWDKIARYLAPADAASLSAIDRSLRPIDEFFAEHRDGARPFARSVLSLRGKWKYVRTRDMFGGDSGEHLAFLDEKFREHVFDPHELKAVVSSSIADYVRAVQGIENKLLVTVRGELDDLDPHIGSAIAGIGGDADFAASYQEMLARVVQDVTRGAKADLGLFVGSFVAAEVTEQLMVRLGRTIATRLGVSAGVLGAGASGGAVSAGVTVGLAIVIDMGIEWLLSLSGSDATSQVTARVEESLDKLHALLIEGDPIAVEAYHKIRARRETFPTEQGRAKIEAALSDIESKGDLGLRRMLYKVHLDRARLREAAIRKLVLEGETI